MFSFSDMSGVPEIHQHDIWLILSLKYAHHRIEDGGKYVRFTKTKKNVLQRQHHANVAEPTTSKSQQTAIESISFIK